MKKLLIMAVVAMLATASFAQVSDTLNVTATINAGVSSLEISGTAAFNHTPSASDRYAVTDELTAEFFAANGPWYIKAESDGLTSPTASHTIDMKIWQPNFGPASYVGDYPDPDVDETYWRNPSEPDNVNWFLILPSTESWKTKLASSEGEDLSPVAFRLGIDAVGHPVANDYAGVVTFTLVIE